MLLAFFKNISIQSTLKTIILVLFVFFMFLGFSSNSMINNIHKKLTNVQEKELSTILFSQKLKDKISKVQDLIVYQVSLKASSKTDDFEQVELQLPLILSELNKFKEFANAQNDKKLMEISKNLNFKYIMFSSKAISLFAYDQIDGEFFDMLRQVSEAATSMNDELSKLALLSDNKLEVVLEKFKESITRTQHTMSFVALLFILFIMILLWSFSSYLIKKIQILSDAMIEFSNDNLSYRIRKLGKNELGYLGNSFNEMALSLEKTMEEKEEKHRMLIQQSKLASMGEMIGNIAHQWRQPLSVISTSTSYVEVKKDMGMLTDEDISENVKLVMKNCEYLSKTIDDFRNFFKPTKTKENFSLLDLLNDTLMIVKASIQNSNILVVKDISSNLKCLGYANELSQVLINLFNNAKDVLSQNNTKDKLLIIKMYEENEKVIIEVLDNGGGIELDIIDKVFEPYFTTKHQSKGTGIGLYMSREIILNHFEGHLSVKNKEFKYEAKNYKGASFKIELPVVGCECKKEEVA